MKLQKAKTVIGVLLTVCQLMIYTGIHNTGNICYGASTDTVTDTETQEIKAQEIDMGDYQSEMTIGEKQLLMVTVLPANATDQTITYFSSNEAIATINGMGRITTLSIGETIITARVGNIEGAFRLTVMEKEVTTEEIPTEENIAVTDIDLGNYESEMEVDKTQNLSVTVLPSDATDASVSYSSSNTAVATVTASGEIKGIAKGTANIIVKAGNITKSIPITVKVSATRLDINSTYLVLKQGEEFALKTTVIPSEASQNVTYKSSDTLVATVTEDGIIRAAAIGNTTIIVSNSDISNAVTVIVNQGGTGEESGKGVEENKDMISGLDKVTEKEDQLIDRINNADDSPILIQAKDYEVVSKKILKRLYETQTRLVVEAENYRITIDGKEIINYENEFHTNIEFIDEKDGISFLINAGNSLPGNITFDLSNKILKTKYLYLYNDTKQKYQMLDNNCNASDITLDIAGKYLITAEKLSNAKISIIVLIIAIISIIGLGAGYVIVKKKYWFW